MPFIELPQFEDLRYKKVKKGLHPPQPISQIRNPTSDFPSHPQNSSPKTEEGESTFQPPNQKDDTSFKVTPPETPPEDEPYNESNTSLNSTIPIGSQSNPSSMITSIPKRLVEERSLQDQNLDFFDSDCDSMDGSTVPDSEEGYLPERRSDILDEVLRYDLEFINKLDTACIATHQGPQCTICI